MIILFRYMEVGTGKKKKNDDRQEWKMIGSEASKIE